MMLRLDRGHAIALVGRMRTITSRFFCVALLGAALIVPVAAATAQDNPRSYHDKKHNDDHEWNNHEDQAYRIYAKENHRKYRDFSRLKENDQQSYWDWRHEHSDAVLKIDIR
jgi:hypothetical protein